jgi:succinoglycan biosynthesis transport protein ExoP
METIEVRRESTVKDFLEVVFRRKRIVVGIVAIATLVMIILTLRQPAVYESAAKVLIKRGEAQGVFDRGVRTLDWQEEIASQIEMVKSRTVVERAQSYVSQFYPTGYKTNLKIQLPRVNSGVVSTSNVLWVTYGSEDPVFCQAAVNAIVTAYREYYSNIRTPPEMEDFFSGEIQRLKEEIEYWREHKEKVLTDGNIVDLDTQRRNLLMRIESYQGELDKIVRDRKEKEAIIGHLDSLLSGGPEAIAAVSSDLTASPLEQNLTQNLRVKLQDFRMRESEMAGRLTDKNLDLMRVREQINDLEQMITKEIQTQLLVSRNQLEINIQRETTLRGILSRLNAEKESYPQREIELERIGMALHNLEMVYSRLEDEHMNAKISVASNPELTVTILDPASPAYRKKTRDYVRMALGPAFSLIVALGLAFFVDNLDHSIKNVSEAEAILGMSVLTSFPDTSRK